MSGGVSSIAPPSPVARAARAWGVDARVIEGGGDARVEGPAVSLPAVEEAPVAGLTRAQKLARMVAELAIEQGLDAGLEVIEHALMGLSVLPEHADARAELRELSERIDVFAERWGHR